LKKNSSSALFTLPSKLSSCEINKMALVIRPSRIHAAGVFATASIRKGSRVVEYTGPRLSPEEANRLYEGASRTYLYGMEDGKTIIDGEGMGAFLNHSCDPNCEVDEVKNRVWIIALRNIQPGEELLWDYSLYDDDDPAPCHCGSLKCRGTMYSREWMAKLRRKARAKAKKHSAARQAKQVRAQRRKKKRPITPPRVESRPAA
jgi:SET domain-containing protein